MESRSREQYTHSERINNVFKEINDLGKKLIGIQNNSLFTHSYIENNPNDWQSHLEGISDFLLFGEGEWWQKDEFGVEFFDSPDLFSICKPREPKTYHLRSSSILDVTKDLNLHWMFILKNNIRIPTNKILEGEEYEKPHIRETNFLSGLEMETTYEITSCTIL